MIRLILAAAVLFAACAKPPDERLRAAAARGDTADVVDAVIRGKVPVDARDAQGRTALMLAARAGKT